MNTEYNIIDVNQIISSPQNIRWTIVPSTINTGKTQFTVYRVRPTFLLPDGRESYLIIQTDRIFSFGVQEKAKLEGDGSNYSIPLCIVDLKTPTAHQQAFVKACDIVRDSGKKYLLENAEKLKKDYIEADLRKMDILWRGKDSAKQGKPMLYAKLPTDKKGQIYCEFNQPYLKNGKVYQKKVNPLLFRDQRCHVKVAVWIESIFIGSNKPSFQTKVHEVLVFPAPKKQSLLTLSKEDLEGLEEENEEESEEEVTEEKEDFPEEEPQRFSIAEPIVANAPCPTAAQNEEVKSSSPEVPRPRRGRARKTTT